MSTPPPPADSAAVHATSSAPSPRPRRRLRLALQLAQVAVLLVLVVLFVLYAVQRQVWPVYGWVAGTPAETFCRRLGGYLWRQQKKLNQQTQDAPLLPEELAQVAPLAERMAAIRATHAVLLRDGRSLFGRLRQADDGSYLLTTFNGQTYDTLPLADAEIVWRKAMVYADTPLTPRDWRFLLRYQRYNPYFLPPYLFASHSGFDRVQALYLALSLLQDEFRQEFGPLCAEAESPVTIHVCLFPDQATFVQEAASRGDLALVNALGFFHRGDHRLYLYDHAAATAPGLGEGERLIGPARTGDAVIRHEGAHQLVAALGVFPAAGAFPFWLEEGIAQYCETKPFGAVDPSRAALLVQAQREGRLLPWDDLLTLTVEQRSKLTGDELALAYTQSWLLFRLLMAKSTRPAFLRYLLAQQEADWQAPPANPEQALLNSLGLPASKYHAQLQQAITVLELAAPPAGRTP